MPSCRNQLLTGLLLLLLFSSCLRSQSSVKKEVEDRLEKEYGEAFTVLSIHEEFIEKPRYTMRVAPVKHPAWEFSATLSKTSSLLTDNYANARLMYEASAALKHYLLPDFKKLAVMVEPSFDSTDSLDAKQMPGFDEILAHQQDGDELEVYVYWFKDYNDSTRKEVLAGIQKIISYYQQKKVLKVDYEIRLYKEKVAANVDIDTMKFCFNGHFSHGRDCFDNLHYADARYSLYFNQMLTDPVPSDSDILRQFARYDSFPKK